MEACIIKIIVLYWTFLVLWGQVVSESNRIEGICDWEARSDRNAVRASVFVVRLTACRSGRLVWKDPYGGVEIVFESSVPMATQGTYRVCLSTTNRDTSIFTRHGNKMEKLSRHGDTRNVTSSDICVESDTKKIVIFLESLNNLKTKSAVFHYRTSFSRNGSGQLRAKDCKMCSYDQLIRSFCGGDFAVQGYVSNILPIGGSKDRGEAVVIAQNILHQSYQIFQKSGKAYAEGFVNFPLYCHWKKRSKHGFLFTGTIRDGMGPVVQCRIKFSRWTRVYHPKICDSVRTSV